MTVRASHFSKPAFNGAPLASRPQHRADIVPVSHRASGRVTFLKKFGLSHPAISGIRLYEISCIGLAKILAP
jgi:hypothetical protein